MLKFFLSKFIKENTKLILTSHDFKKILKEYFYNLSFQAEYWRVSKNTLSYMISE